MSLPVERRIETVTTTPSPVLWRDTISSAWGERFASEVEDRALAVLWAQWAIETGRGANCKCWNYGNIRAFDGWDGLWCVLRTWEMVEGKRVDCNGDFRAFRYARAGALDFLNFVGRASYAPALARIVAGDGAGYAHILKLLGYYTAPESDYTAGIVSLSSEFLRALAARAKPSPILLTSEEIAEHDAAEALAQESLPLACFDPSSLATTLVRYTCDDRAA